MQISRPSPDTFFWKRPAGRSSVICLFLYCSWLWRRGLHRNFVFCLVLPGYQSLCFSLFCVFLTFPLKLSQDSRYRNSRVSFCTTREICAYQSRQLAKSAEVTNLGFCNLDSISTGTTSTDSDGRVRKTVNYRKTSMWPVLHNTKFQCSMTLPLSLSLSPSLSLFSVCVCVSVCLQICVSMCVIADVCVCLSVSSMCESISACGMWWVKVTLSAHGHIYLGAFLWMKSGSWLP